MEYIYDRHVSIFHAAGGQCGCGDHEPCVEREWRRFGDWCQRYYFQYRHAAGYVDYRYRPREQPIVGFNHGAGHHDRVLATLRLSIIVSTLITGVGCIVSLLFPRLIVSVFSTDAELVSITDNGLRLTMLVFFVVGSQITISQFFQSIGVAWKAMFLSLSRQVLFLIPAILLFPPIWGLDGVWLAQPFSDFIAAVTAWGFLWYHVKNVKNKG